MIYPPVPYPPIPRCSPKSVTEPVEVAPVEPSHPDFEAASTTPSRPPSPQRSPNASDSGAIPTRETSLALDARAVDLVLPTASVQPPQLQATLNRARPSAARPSFSSSSRSPLTAAVSSSSRAPPPPGQATSTTWADDIHAKASLATEILRLEHRVALLRKARRVQLANDHRAERDSTAKLERRAEKWREAGALAAELLLDRFGVVVSAAASTFSSSPLNAGRPSTTLFGSSTFLDDDDTASDYLPTPLTTTSRVFSSLGGPSHADRLADFRRSLTATAHARGISEQEVLRQLEEEEGLDPLQSPEVEFDRMLLTPTRAGRKRKRREEARVVTRGLDDDEEDQKPDFASSSSASITTRSLPGWKPPRAERGDAPFPQSRMTTKKEQLSSPRLPPPPIDSGDDDDDDDELMRALDTDTFPPSRRRTNLAKRNTSIKRQSLRDAETTEKIARQI
ncbi:hypothetical protein B0A53_03738 [Rhodotorula sp. CCFEE 5036]|nr:hypothetical protein B0A53_03738 [Rhodotorula sp. CCFEE 5036]